MSYNKTRRPLSGKEIRIVNLHKHSEIVRKYIIPYFGHLPMISTAVYYVYSTHIQWVNPAACITPERWGERERESVHFSTP
jgi:hypothetical protein